MGEQEQYAPKEFIAISYDGHVHSLYESDSVNIDPSSVYDVMPRSERNSLGLNERRAIKDAAKLAGENRG